MQLTPSRQGTTLMELLVFLAFFAVCSTVIVSLLIASNENTVRQEMMSGVEQGGVTLTELIKRRVRTGERVLDPAIGESGDILALQMGDETANPTILFSDSGSLFIVYKEQLQRIVQEDITISDFSVTNTSADADSPSVLISYTISGSVAVPSTTQYVRDIEIVVALHPDDALQGDDCGCSAPQCSAPQYTYEVCESDTCRASTLVIPCTD